MKQIFKTIFVASLIVSAHLGYSQNNTLTKFKGRINNSPQGEFNVSLKYFDLTSMEEATYSINTPIDSKGRFELETDKIVDDVWHVSMRIGNEISQVTVFPGDDLTISVNAKEFDESIEYKGKGAEKNNYKAAKYLRNEERDNSIKTDPFKLPFDEFIDIIQEVNNKHIETLDAIYDGEEKDAFYEMEKLNLQNDLVVQVLGYEKQHHYVNYDKAKAMLIDMNPSDNPAIFHYAWHRRSIANYVRFMAGVAPSDLKIYQTAKEVLSGDALRYFNKNNIIPLLSGDDAAAIIAEIKVSSVNKDYLTQIDQAYKYQLSLKENYPNKPSQIVYFSESLQKSTMKITGHIDKYDGKTKMATVYDSGLGGKERIDGEIANDGTFSIDIPVYYSHETYIRIGRILQTVLISPNGRLHMEIEAVGVQYYGDGAGENVVLNDYIKASRSNDHPYRRDDLLEVDPNEIKRAFIDKYERQLIVVEDYFSDEKTLILKEWALVDAMQNNFSALYGFESYRRYRNKKKGIDLIPIPDGFYDFDEKVNVMSKSLICSGTIDLVQSKVPRYPDLPGENDVERAINLLNEGLKTLNQFEYELVFTNIMNEWISAKDFGVVDALIDRYVNEIRIDWLVSDMQEKVDFEKKVLAGLVIPEGANLNNLSKSSGDSLLTSILSKHKGKVIYIDMWATWCGPCIGEFAFAKDFHKGIDHDKVAMVYMAGHSKENVWKSMIGKHKLEGDHYLLSDEQYQVISAKFEARGFPHYAIIDQKGIIKYKDAQRPSIVQEKLNEGLIETLNTL